MAKKLDKKQYPENSSPADFQCFGPPALHDGEFESVKICDMGCFKQDGQDTNKYYHGAIVKHKTSGNWYVYFEWGRVGQNPTFQFVQCSSEDEAQKEFSKQLHSKNDKRGQWVQIAGIKTLQAKAGKDCYLVRPQSARSTGLPDAKTIKFTEGATPQKKKNSSKRKSVSVDKPTLDLMRDLNVATQEYTRGSMADDSLPTATAINEARDILSEAQKRILVVGDSIEDQLNDKEIMQLTSTLYSRIPKKKKRRAIPEEWLLTGNNILMWGQDLDAFESALSGIVDDAELEHDPFGGMPLRMEWVDPKSTGGKFLYSWWPKATANKHGYLKTMQIKNMWVVDRHGDESIIKSAQDKILNKKIKISHRPKFQPSERLDLEPADQKRYADSNTALLFHGTRSVNVSGILRESLRLPKQLVGVVITGAMFGPGLYWADDWKKSAGYTSLMSSYWSRGSGSIPRRGAFMFAADVCLGNPHLAPGPKGYTAPPRGHDSVFGKAGASQVQNNEFITYNTKQSRLKYLIEFAA